MFDTSYRRFSISERKLNFLLFDENNLSIFTSFMSMLSALKSNSTSNRYCVNSDFDDRTSRIASFDDRNGKTICRMRSFGNNSHREYVNDERPDGANDSGIGRGTCEIG